MACPPLLSEIGAHAAWIASPLAEADFELRRCTMEQLPRTLDSGLYNVLIMGRFYTLRWTVQPMPAVQMSPHFGLVEWRGETLALGASQSRFLHL